jgi:putative ABC transport system permease protein
MGLDSIAIALRGIGANKLRSSLTVLGVLIGVGAVILLVAVGNGSSVAIQQRIQALGTNTLTVVNRQGGGGPQRAGTRSAAVRITDADVTALEDRQQAPDIVAVSPVVTVASVTATYADASATVASFIGSDDDYLTTTARTVDLGRALTPDDISEHARVLVIGRTTAANLFAAGQDVVGTTVHLNGTAFRIVGVQAAKGANGAQDLDDVAVAPYTAVQDTLAGRGQGYPQVVVQAASAEVQNDAQSEILAILNSRHAVTNASSSPFTVRNQASLLQTSEDTNRTFTVLLGAVAAISLLVGGIGVMNIMLVSVTERTREIGIRKAIGAPRAAILGQFVAEAVLLSLLGGLAGVAAGVVGSHFEIAGVKPVIAQYSIPLAFGVSIAVGLFFGIYPANRAAALRPIDALRHE